MVKINKNSGGPELPQSDKLSNESCSAEAAQALLKGNRLSHNTFEDSAVNGNSDESCSAEGAEAVLKVIGSSLNDLEDSAVNSNTTDKAPVKEVAWRSTNGKCSNTSPVNGLENGNCNNQPIRDSSIVNGDSKMVSINDIPTVNGNFEKMSVNDAPIVNGDFEQIPVNILKVNGNSEKVAVNDVPTVSGNCGDSSPVGVPVLNENISDGSNTPLESGSCSNFHIAVSPREEVNCDENKRGFIVIEKKKRKKNKQKNHPQKPSSNLPPGMNAESSSCDKRNDKKLDEKTSPTHLSQKPPSRNFSSITSSEKSYSSALVNGLNGNSQVKNGVSNVYSDTQNVMKCGGCNEKKNPELAENCISFGHLSTDTFKSILSSDIIAFKQKQSNSSTKVQMTDVCHQNEMSPSQKECLSSYEEVIHESEKSDSLIDSVEDTTDESSNAAYCESLDGACLAEEPILDGYGYGEEKSLYDIYNVRNLLKSQPWEVWPHVYENTVGRDNYLYEYGRYVYYPSCVMNLQEPTATETVSNDSGRGGDDQIYDKQMPYLCKFPKEEVRNLIGKKGTYRKTIFEQSGAKFWVLKDMSVDKDTTIVSFTGTGAEIKKAKELIKRRFPNVSLRRWFGPQCEQWSSTGPPLSCNYYATLPVGADFMGVISCIFTPHYFWVQQYGHPQYHLLEDLERRMSYHFNTVMDAPEVVNPLIGSVVAVPVFFGEDNNIKWVRGEVTFIMPESGRIIVRYLDHGGEVEIPGSEIRPMRQEFLSIPFFATKCCLSGVIPTGGVWLEAACAELQRLCNSIDHPPIVRVVSLMSDCYIISIAGYDDETNLRVDVATTLIRKGLAESNYAIYPLPEPVNGLVQ